MQKTSQIKLSDKKLVRELVLIVTIKVFLIFSIWWVFFRNEKVNVSAESMASVMDISAPSTNNQNSLKEKGETQNDE